VLPQTCAANKVAISRPRLAALRGASAWRVMSDQSRFRARPGKWPMGRKWRADWPTATRGA
jgi:hypothetical protein